MERSPVRDLIVGIFVLAGLAAIAYLSISIGGFSWHGKGGLKLTMKLDETGGLEVRAPVVISGVQVGEVTKISLAEDNNGYRALVEMEVRKDLHLSKDTIASVYTSGMLGDRYISLKTGADEDLKSGEEITHTESAVVLEQILKAVMYGLTKDDSNKPAATAPQTTRPTTSP